MIFNPERLATFLAFMGYPTSEVVAALKQQYPDCEADALAKAAEEKVRADENYEQTVLAKNEAAIRSEHNV